MVRTERRRHGLHFRRNRDDKVFSDVIVLDRNGELMTITMDEFTVLRKGSAEHEMGVFYVRCRLEHIAHRDRSVTVSKLLVDTGSECTWIPAATLDKLGVQREKKDVPFVLANGQEVTRTVGYAIIRVEKAVTIDEVVFAEAGDLALLGARTLEGLNLRVDSVRRSSSPPGHCQPHSQCGSKKTTSSGQFGTVFHGRSVPRANALASGYSVYLTSGGF